MGKGLLVKFYLKDNLYLLTYKAVMHIWRVCSQLKGAKPSASMGWNTAFSAVSIPHAPALVALAGKKRHTLDRVILGKAVLMAFMAAHVLEGTRQHQLLT